METYATIYKKELLESIVPFWETYSIDNECGGYFTCLDAKGMVYDTDKFIWLQARQVWMFATLYKRVSTKNEWKEIAVSGARFLENYGRDNLGYWYFSLDRSGAPLIMPYNIFSDCFAAMAFSALYDITQEDRYASIALRTFENILLRQQNPKGTYDKHFPGTRSMKNFALPMILCNLSMEMADLLGANKVQEITSSVVRDIMEHFYQHDTGLVLENVAPNGNFIDSFEGRLINPGHAIEAMWFVMNVGLENKDNVLFRQAEDIMYRQLENGWDFQYGGIFYFMDYKGYPPQQLEHDQKLWWVHLETLVALAKTYAHTKSDRAKDWFLRVHEYTWQHFRDKKHGGEWWGYLNRQGEVLLQLKGGKWKGCFHVPRALLEIWKTLESIEVDAHA